MNLPDWVVDNKIQLVGAVLGLFLMGIGVWQSLQSRMEADSQVTIVSESDDRSDSEESLVVDVSGAVQSPGVYSFNVRSRVNDALVAGGGLSSEADREYVSRFINLAEPLVDGMKLYIPYQGQLGKDEISNTLVLGSKNGGVNVNKASLSELDTLWGVGPARAQQIIDNRPYSSTSELITKAKIPQNVLEQNEGKLLAF